MNKIAYKAPKAEYLEIACRDSLLAESNVPSTMSLDEETFNID